MLALGYKYLCCLWGSDICSVSGVPSMEWPLVMHKSSAKIVDQDVEPRVQGVVGRALGNVSWWCMVPCLGF